MNFKSILFITLIIIFPFSSYSADFEKTVDKLIKKSCANNHKTGVSIVDLNTGKIVYELNPDLQLLPASLMKIFTSSAALYYLGPDFKFKTDILYKGKLERDYILGDLIIKGSGDPKITPENLFAIADTLRRLRIRYITGDLIIDNSLFERSDLIVQNSTEPYDAKIAPFSINFNTITVEVHSRDDIKEKPIVSTYPSSAYIKVANNITPTRFRKTNISISLKHADDHLIISLKGYKNINDRSIVKYLSVPDPVAFSGYSALQYLQDRNVKVNGRLKESLIPLTDTTLLFSHYSEPLKNLLADLNRYSNNFMAEQIAYSIDAYINKKRGSGYGSRSLILDFVKQITGDTANIKFADGSGLSRRTKVTAGKIRSMIYNLSKYFDIWPDFLASLPIIGKEGTVVDRLKDSDLKGLARVKTGTLSDASGLAGVVFNVRNNHLYGFAIMINGNSCGYFDADQLEDDIVKKIYSENFN